MAVREWTLHGDFAGVLAAIHRDVLAGSTSASYENGSDITTGDVRIGVRVYERYSMIGGNRLSLTITLVGRGPDLYLSAITSGGSQAMLFKMNTFGESAFLKEVAGIVESL